MSVLVHLRTLAFDIGRRIGKHPLASRLFCLVEPVLPLQRLGRSAHAVAFRHPRPSYQPHSLVVPTITCPELSTLEIDNKRKAMIVWEMIVLAKKLTDDDEGHWQLVVNGGERQDIGQVHGHLIRARSQREDEG